MIFRRHNYKQKNNIILLLLRSHETARANYNNPTDEASEARIGPRSSPEKPHNTPPPPTTPPSHTRLIVHSEHIQLGLVRGLRMSTLGRVSPRTGVIPAQSE